MPIPLPPMPPPPPIPRPQVPMPPLSWRHDNLGEKLIKQQQNEEKEAAERKPTLGEILDELLRVE